MPPGGGVTTASAGATARDAACWAELVDASSFAALEAPWRALCARAAVPNAFMEPAFAQAVAEQFTQPVRVLLAWQAAPGPEGRRLVGAWLALLGRSRLSWPRPALISPASAVAYLGTPVLDRAALRPALRSLLLAMRRDPDLPDLVQIGDFSAELLPELRAVLQELDMRAATVERRRRARLLPHPDPTAFWAGSMSKGRRQGLERQRRQLARAGVLAFTVVRAPEAVPAAIEEFLALEGSGWKARRESALASDRATAALTRRMAEGLARRGLLAVHALRLDGRPLAMGIILYSGAGAFTWRTAFDENHRRASPGVLLLEDTTRELLTDPAVAVTDSCNHRDAGFQAERWPERHELVDLLIGLRRRQGLGVALLAARERGLRGLKEYARRGRNALRETAPRLRAVSRRMTDAVARLRR